LKLLAKRLLNSPTKFIGREGIFQRYRDTNWRYWIGKRWNGKNAKWFFECSQTRDCQKAFTKQWRRSINFSVIPEVCEPAPAVLDRVGYPSSKPKDGFPIINAGNEIRR